MAYAASPICLARASEWRRRSGVRGLPPVVAGPGCAAPVRLLAGTVVKKRPPALILAIAGVALLFLVLPVAGLLQRAPWSQLGHELAASDVRSAVGLSVLTSFLAAALAILFGAPLAWVLARVEFKGKAEIGRASCRERV